MASLLVFLIYHRDRIWKNETRRPLHFWDAVSSQFSLGLWLVLLSSQFIAEDTEV